MFALFFVLSRVHIIIIGHEIFADGKENCNTQYADQGFDWSKMFDYHLSGCCEH